MSQIALQSASLCAAGSEGPASDTRVVLPLPNENNTVRWLNALTHALMDLDFSPRWANAKRAGGAPAQRPK
jgi:hypothetical protein